jgi:hypothetical protein
VNRSESISLLAAALHKAQGKIKAALKDSTNPHFRSKYADLSSVVDAVKSPLLECGISFLQGVQDAEGGVAVETMLLHTSGEWISSTLRIPAVKQDAQGYGSAITYGRRYGLQAMCGVPAEDDDGNAATASTESSGAIKPTDGARGRVDPKRRKMVEDTATIIKDALQEDRDFDAYAHCENFTDPDEKVYLWSFLDSKERRRLKAQAEVANKQGATA